MKEQTVQLAKKLGKTESHKKLLSIIFTYLLSDRVGDIVLVGECLLLRSYPTRCESINLIETTVKLIIFKPGQKLSSARMIKIRLIREREHNKRFKFTNYEVLAD